MSTATLEPRPVDARAAAPTRGTVLIATVNRIAGDTGVHTHTRSLAAGLRDFGVDVEIVTPFDAGRQWLPIFAVRPLVLRRLNPTWGTRWYRHWHLAALRASLRKAMRRPGVQHMLAQCPLSARAALDVRAELRAARRISITAICHFNRSEADEYRDKGELADPAAYGRMLDFESATLAQVDHVAYVSDWAKQLVEQDRDIPTRGSSVIWNGLAEVQRSVSPLDRASLLGLADDDIAVLNVGTLEPRKNQVALVTLFARLLQCHPAAVLLLVGDGPDRANVQAAIARLGIAGRVRLLGHRTDVAELMRVADVYLHFAKAENCPVVLIEAARAGLPIAALPVGGVPEILATIGEAVTLDAADDETSLERLTPWLTSRDARARAGRRASDAFRAHFGVEAMVRKYLEIMDANARQAEGSAR